jgi:hypothetical protein
MEGAGGITKRLGQCDPFDMPRAGRALEIRHHRIEHQSGLWHSTFAAARISSHEIGVRFWGIVELDPRP